MKKMAIGLAIHSTKLEDYRPKYISCMKKDADVHFNKKQFLWGGSMGRLGPEKGYKYNTRAK